MLRLLEVCAGIGGISLGFEITGHFQAVGFVEIDTYAQKILNKHWPDVPCYRDVRSISAWTLPHCDVLAGGIPCQPHSLAGKRGGADDKRDLWPEFFRLVCEIQPAYAVVENVPGLRSSDGGRFFGTILRDLAQAGYDAEWCSFPASAVGAPHQRERVWIVAYPSRQRIHQEQKQQPECNYPLHTYGNGAVRNVQHPHKPATTRSNQRELEPRDIPRSDWWAVEPDMGRTFDGISYSLDGIGGLDADATEVCPRSLLPALLGSDGAENDKWTNRGLDRLYASQVLQSRMYGEGLCQRCAITQGYISLAGAEDAEIILRELWSDGQSSRASYRRERAEQLAREYPDLVWELSRYSPPPCTTCWKDGSWEDGIARVAHGVPNRSHRLRCLGNAVVPQCAAVVADYIWQHYERLHAGRSCV